jgi:hypothetical protein
MAKESPSRQRARNERINARRALLEELFNDFYDDRRNIYKMNFFRGVFFGLGSVLGGTIVVAIIVWSLSLFVHIPGIGNAVQDAQNTIESGQKK